MTNYSTEDLENDWEFKIVHSSTNAFRDPEKFQTLLHEEAMAGWTMVEKLNDSQVRFKRLQDIRRRDVNLITGIDPYRSQFDSSPRPVQVIWATVSAFLLGLGVFVIVLLGNYPDNGEIIWLLITLLVPVVILIIIAVILVIRRLQER